MRLRISKIHAAAKDRPPGYVEAVLAAGTVDGEWLDITAEAMAELRERYRPPVADVIHGLTRVTHDMRLEPPPLPVMMRSAAQAVVSEVRAKIAKVAPVTKEEVARRMVICQSCEHFIFGQRRCRLCGCFAALKTRLRSQHCPEKRW